MDITDSKSQKLLARCQLWATQLENYKPAPDQHGYDKTLVKLQHKAGYAKKLEELHEKIAATNTGLRAEQDPQMKELWQEELNMLGQTKLQLETEVTKMLLPCTNESVIIEIRAGEGGEEASIFSMELANMYAKLAKKNKWEWHVFSMSYSECGGLKEGVFEMTGGDVSYMLACEGGVHCVKRVPKTEKKGRVHTSTATIAVLLEPQEVEITLHEKDLKIDVFRSSGPGGQSVNTTDSAVRITHIPTGIVVSQQDEKSQHKNKEKALKILKARIYQRKLEEAQTQQDSKRKQAVGRAKRNERIRTYHFLQNWVKDDRLDMVCHDVESFMEADVLHEFIQHLVWEYIEE